MTHPQPTHPPTPSVPGPSKVAAYYALAAALGSFELARAWGRVVVGVARLASSLVRSR